ncbi:GTPase ObgE [Candidatus Kaiserbacteria bacterium]|nr:GTPase ObgE [Candidatus Kaiserbacteria bacterium]
MKFIDEITLSVKAGDGGNGVVRWLHEKGKEFGGPSGGDGGSGGSVYARAVRDINILSKYRGHTHFEAERGGGGEKNSRHGKDGGALCINLPVGSIVTNKKTGKSFELLSDGEETLMLTGGRGGLGNEHFKSSRNIRPKEWTPGKKGESADFYIELALIADAGIIGLPNAGKTSLLNALTHARAKVGSYQFTTLDPNLGDFYGFILADIPGLIEGASGGKGLGYKFLRHITRTRVLIHCISLETVTVFEDYETIRQELLSYNEELGAKKEIIVLTKSDLVSDEKARETNNLFRERMSREVFVVSVLNDVSMKVFSDALVKLLKE